MTQISAKPWTGYALLLVALMTVIAVYWPGLYGGWLFDDYPNIVDNQGVHPQAVSVPSLVRAALSSPASEFKRPLAALSFAANYLTVGLEPFWWKLTNLVVHLLNGLLVFWLARLLLDVAGRRSEMPAARHAADTTSSRAGIVAALIAAAWMLLPINLTGVLYVVQRMESMANVFVLLGLIGYTIGRQRMLAAGRVDAGTQLQTTDGNGGPDRRDTWLARQRCFILCAISITVPAAVGLLAKETAVMLPLYALLVEWALFRFYRAGTMLAAATENTVRVQRRDLRIISLFGVVLVLPILVGLTWLVPHVLNPETWATRDFTLGTRLLSEARIVVDYIGWTVVPSPGALAFYHDDFSISTGLLAPWTTLASIVGLAALTAFAAWVRARRPLVALGIALFLGCQLLTGTILPLELIYEHRNYFASFGLMLALVPVFVAPAQEEQGTGRSAGLASHSVAAGRTGEEPAATTHPAARAELGAIALPLAVLRYALFGVLLLLWIGLTGFTAYKWGNPLRLAEELALRAPQSPRAQYELGRAYIIYSRYDPTSPFTPLVYAPLERAAALPGSSILPEQALIFMNARMHLPLKDAWWDSMIAKLKARPPGIQDESSLASLTQCARDGQCALPIARMTQAFTAALTHPDPSARLLATYGDYAWNVLNDHALGERMTRQAVQAKPNEPAYRITLIRMLSAQGRMAEARATLKKLETLNFGGRLNGSLVELGKLVNGQGPAER